MSWNDSDYFERRAVVERELAHASSDPRVIAAHRELAERYEALTAAGAPFRIHLARYTGLRAARVREADEVLSCDA
jgi:hypothetical protein